jgi:capsular polysaccharide export protein
MDSAERSSLRVGPDRSQILNRDRQGGNTRVYLFLQGHPSPFWRQLFDELRATSVHCLKINLCLADSAFWLGAAATSYRGSLEAWPNWLTEYCLRAGVTDIIYFADQHPYHRSAREIAKPLGITCWAIEFGYLRPDWITLEEDGMGPLSHFPGSPVEIIEKAKSLPRPDLVVRYSHEFGQEAFLEVLFNLLMVFGRPFFPRYVSDKAFWPVLEYLGWLPLLLASSSSKEQARKIQKSLVEDNTSYNIVAMQMRGDYQIRAASRFPDLVDFVDEVLASFSRHAPPDRKLVFKLHPLESGYHMWGRRIRRLARKHGVSDRIQVIRGGDLHFLLAASRGVILVNSTVGLHALRLGIPTCALGRAIYAVPGLTHGESLDLFWTAPGAVDRQLFDAFERALTTIQVKGSFFNGEGRHNAVAEIIDRLTQS